MTGTDHRAKGTQSAQLWALTDNHTLTVKVTHNGYLKSPAKSASDQGFCGGDMSPPDGICETRNTKSGSEKGIDAGHVGNIISRAAETPL